MSNHQTNRCIRCGEVFRPEDRFCRLCGFNLSALETSEVATQVSLRANELQFELAKTYYNGGKYEQAAELLKKLLEIDPDNREVSRAYEDACAALGGRSRSRQS